MRLIDADKLKPDIKTFLSAYSEELIKCYSQEVIDNASTVEAEPMKYGKWQKAYMGMDSKGSIHLGDTKHTGYLCSICGCLTYPYIEGKLMAKYCPNCGAKMGKE